ncbi:MAG: very short patch repair endonuclease [Candidatus Baltobacteraceae bacterium]
MNKSEQMRRVRRRDTAPELAVRHALSRLGVRYRLHRKDLPGKPDVYVGRLRLAIFVNGCFWHGHDCPRGKRPSSNAEFWRAKINRNCERDAKVVRELAERGIESLTLWQCSLRHCDEVAAAVAARYRRTS